MLNEYGLVSSDGVIGQQAPNHVMLDSAITGTIDATVEACDRIAETLRGRTRRAWLIGSLVGNLGLLAVLKYGWAVYSSLADLTSHALDAPS